MFVVVGDLCLVIVVKQSLAVAVVLIDIRCHCLLLLWVLARFRRSLYHLRCCRCCYRYIHALVVPSCRISFQVLVVMFLAFLDERRSHVTLAVVSAVDCGAAPCF